MFLQFEKIKITTARFPASVLGVFGMALLIGACSGSGADGQVASNGEELVCENIEVTGTRFPRRVCRTESAWAAIRDNERDAADEYGRQTNQNSGILEDAEGPPLGY